MTRSKKDIREDVEQRIRERSVLENTQVDVQMESLLAADAAVRAELQARQQALEAKLRENTAALERLELEYQQAVETEQQALRSPLKADSTEAGLQTYLEWLYQQCASVSLAGIDRKAASQQGEARLNLDDIYTALLTTAIQQEQEQKGRERDEAFSRLLSERREQRLSAVAQLNAHERLVLLGGPGSGKSTFVNFAVMCMAGEWLRRGAANEEHYAALSQLTEPLPQQETNEKEQEAQRQPWDHGALIPVRLILRDFAAWRGLPPTGESLTVEHFWEFMRTQFRNASQEPCLPALRRHLVKEGGLLLFDGLDEVPEAEQRRKQIIQLVECCAGEFCRCRIVVTSRTYAYQEQQWGLKGFHVAELAPFTEAQIAAFIARWYHHVGKLQHWHADKIEDRINRLRQAIDSSFRLQEFAERPLLLALMASLHAWRGGSLPEKREELYDDAVELLLDWWESQKVSRKSPRNGDEQKSLSELLSIEKDRLRQALSALAFNAHAQQTELAGTADIPEPELVNALMRVSQTRDLDPALLVNYLSHRAGLLVPRGVGIYTFPHRTFQEYLAACHLTDQDDYPDNLAELTRQTPERWREVLLLAAAHASNVAPMIWALTDALCPQDPSGNVAVLPTTNDAYCALFVAQALKESADLSRISPRNTAKFERVRRWLKVILTEGMPFDSAQETSKPLPARERALAGNLLAIFGDDRPGVGLRADGLPDIDWVEIPAGEFWMGSDETFDKDSSKDERPRHRVTFREPFQISRFPITNAQYEAFIEAGGYATEAYWTTEGWAWKKGRTDRYRPGGAFDLPNHPVVGVSWYEAMAFCAWLTEQFRAVETHGRASLQCRLPTEAEWEYAARGPSLRHAQGAAQYPWSGEITPEHANYQDTNLGATSAVGCFPKGCVWWSDDGGLDDMAGNVYEWCLDVWHDNYEHAPDDGSAWLEGGNEDWRVQRGGYYGSSAKNLRCACRDWDYRRHYWGDLHGFRVVLVGSGLRSVSPF